MNIQVWDVSNLHLKETSPAVLHVVQWDCPGNLAGLALLVQELVISLSSNKGHKHSKLLYDVTHIAGTWGYIERLWDSGIYAVWNLG